MTDHDGMSDVTDEPLSVELWTPIGVSPEEILGDADPAGGHVAAYLTSHRSERTRVAYLSDLRHFHLWARAHGTGLLEARHDHVDAYLRALERAGRKRSTLSRRLATLTGFYRYLEQVGATGHSPTAFVRRQPVDRSIRSTTLERQEAIDMLHAARAASPRDHALACLLVLNGLRVSEACACDVEDLSTERGHRTLRLTRRGDVHDIVPLARRTHAALLEHLDGRTTGPLLTSGEALPAGISGSALEARRLDRYDATRIVRRLARRAGITKHVTPQSLRHAMITLAMDAGVGLRDVQEAAGHADLETTLRYHQRRSKLDRHATYRVARYLDGPNAADPSAVTASQPSGTVTLADDWLGADGTDPEPS